MWITCRDARIHWRACPTLVASWIPTGRHWSTTVLQLRKLPLARVLRPPGDPCRARTRGGGAGWRAAAHHPAVQGRGRRPARRRRRSGSRAPPPRAACWARSAPPVWSPSGLPGSRPSKLCSPPRRHCAGATAQRLQRQPPSSRHRTCAFCWSVRGSAEAPGTLSPPRSRLVTPGSGGHRPSGHRMERVGAGCEVSRAGGPAGAVQQRSPSPARGGSAVRLERPVTDP